MATFAARYGLTIDAIAARLGLEVEQLLVFDRTGGPGWLRLALVGVAVDRGESTHALAWLWDSPEPPRVHEAPPTCGPGTGPGEQPG